MIIGDIQCVKDYWYEGHNFMLHILHFPVKILAGLTLNAFYISSKAFRFSLKGAMAHFTRIFLNLVRIHRKYSNFKVLFVMGHTKIVMGRFSASRRYY